LTSVKESSGGLGIERGQENKSEKPLFAVIGDKLREVRPCWPTLSWRALVACLFAFVAGANQAASADLAIAKSFFPNEAAATVEEVGGAPPSAIVRAGDGRVLGYAFSTREVSGSVGYSGRPIDIVAAVTAQGVVAGAAIVAHEEPILVIGIPREALAAYVANFRGFDVGATDAVRAAGPVRSAPQAVAGASVTSAVIRDAILRSARAVLRGRDAKTVAGTPRLDRETLRRLSWPALVAEGAVRKLQVTRGEAARLRGGQDGEPDKSFIELWLALATPPAIGESLLGQRVFESALAQAGPDDDLVLIGASGLYSFMGTEWRRSGVFERVEIVQGATTVRLKAADYTRIAALRAPAAPELREIGLFRIARSSGFDPTKPFRLDVTLARDPPAPDPPPVVSLEYRIPDRYVLGSPEPPAATTSVAPAPSQPAAGVNLHSAEAAPMNAPLWQDIWWARRFEIGGLCLMLAALGGILIFQNEVAASVRFHRRLRMSYLALTFLFLGLLANAQLSVVNVITFIHAFLSGFRWELFLLDPMAFILWSFVAASLLFWGRGVFCGWLCPFGAIQELLNEFARRLGVRQIVIPFGLHERLWMIKYVIFLVILAVSLHSIMTAFTLAEVEPFKTAITLKFMRDWPFVVYAAVLLVIGLFVERFFCRYLCPLGAAIAIPARLRMFEWLRRYRECGFECQICARHCTVQAIHPLGQINPHECIYCLQCQAIYYDKRICLHLVRREERRVRQKSSRAKKAGVPTLDGGTADA
jgi:transcriptional regulator of nitric oxide reductase